MNTLNFLDANVWLALLWSRHVHAERARSWFEQAGEEQFIFCRFTHITVLRLLTTEKIMGADTKSMSQPRNLWDRIWADQERFFGTFVPVGATGHLRAITRAGPIRVQ